MMTAPTTQSRRAIDCPCGLAQLLQDFALSSGARLITGTSQLPKLSCQSPKVAQSLLDVSDVFVEESVDRRALPLGRVAKLQKRPDFLD